MFRLLIVFFSVFSVFSVANSSPPGDPWAAFRRGNELLRQAQQAGLNSDPAWLIRALRHYRACLSRQASTPNAGTLFEDARHNLEMAKLLLMQISRDGNNVGQPDPRDPRDPRSQAPLGNTRREAELRNPPRAGNLDAKRSFATGVPKQSLRTRESPPRESSPQAQRDQQRPQQSQGNSASSSARQTGQNRAANGRKMRAGGQGTQSGDSDPTQKKRPDKPDAKPQAARGQIPGGDAGKTSSSDDAHRSSDADQGTTPTPSDRPGEDKRRERGRGRGPEPDPGGLFHPETPAAKQKQPAPGRGSQGDSAGGGPNKEKKDREMDPVLHAAVMRLQEAIQRIENRRGRRVIGPETGPEDPANLNRYRDW